MQQPNGIWQSIIASIPTKGDSMTGLIGHARRLNKDIPKQKFVWESFARTISMNRRLQCGMNALRCKGIRRGTIISACFKSRGGLPRDLKQAEQCFLRASRYVEAAYEYYECYRLRTGDDWEENEKEVMQACRLLKGSADGGYAPAQYTLGMLYESYNDPEEAQTYLKAAAKQGHTAAVEYLCTMYAQQYMAAGDFKKALKYLKKGSKRDGHGICAYMCGDFWEHNYRGLLPWDDNQPNRASRTSIASHWYSYSYLRGYKPALEHVIRCFLITNKVEPTTENIASVESFLKNGCLILTYKNIRTIYYDIYPGW